MPLAPPMRCPLCGGSMHDTTGGCGSCPMNSGCDMLCCEECGYETVKPRSVTIDFLSRLLRPRRREPSAS